MLVNHYRIVEKIGSGGMVEMYIAENAKLNHPVALERPRHKMETVRANSGLSRKGWR
jgi:serine/threonine protein kinase